MFDERHHRSAAASIQERKRECRDRSAAAIQLYREKGLSLRQIARKLDAAGIWPPAAFTGNHFWRKRNRWSAQAVKRIANTLGIE